MIVVNDAVRLHHDLTTRFHATIADIKHSPLAATSLGGSFVGEEGFSGASNGGVYGDDFADDFGVGSGGGRGGFGGFPSPLANLSSLKGPESRIRQHTLSTLSSIPKRYSSHSTFVHDDFEMMAIVMQDDGNKQVAGLPSLDTQVDGDKDVVGLSSLDPQDEESSSFRRVFIEDTPEGGIVGTGPMNMSARPAGRMGSHSAEFPSMCI
jgi:hypothetical protein